MPVRLTITLPPWRCLPLQELETASLCHGGSSPQAEALGLVIAVMAERCRGKKSRYAVTGLYILIALRQDVMWAVLGDPQGASGHSPMCLPAVGSGLVTFQRL